MTESERSAAGQHAARRRRFANFSTVGLLSRPLTIFVWWMVETSTSSPETPRKSYLRLEQKLAEVREISAIPPMLGGDHGVTYPAMWRSPPTTIRGPAYKYPCGSPDRRSHMLHGRAQGRKGAGLGILRGTNPRAIFEVRL